MLEATVAAYQAVEVTLFGRVVHSSMRRDANY